MGRDDDTAAEGTPGAGYQARVGLHVAEVTRGDPTDLAERRDRFGEESVELAQALGMTREEAHALVDYVFGRPAGDPGKEFGGVSYTLAALANEAGQDLAARGEEELARLSAPEAIARIRHKRSGRHGRGPLPGLDPGVPAVRPRGGPGMDFREEARIGCSILMIGGALATLSGLTGLAYSDRVTTLQVGAIGVLVLLMVACAGGVLVKGTRRWSAGAVGAGLLSAAAGAALVGHQFLWAFPAFYAVSAMASLAVTGDGPGGPR